VGRAVLCPPSPRKWVERVTPCAPLGRARTRRLAWWSSAKTRAHGVTRPSLRAFDEGDFVLGQSVEFIHELIKLLVGVGDGILERGLFRLGRGRVSYPNGVTQFSPGLRDTSYPGTVNQNVFNPNGVVACRGGGDATPLGLGGK
jgi:hypothetical protein